MGATKVRVRIFCYNPKAGRYHTSTKGKAEVGKGDGEPRKSVGRDTVAICIIICMLVVKELLHARTFPPCSYGFF